MMSFLSRMTIAEPVALLRSQVRIRRRQQGRIAAVCNSEQPFVLPAVMLIRYGTNGTIMKRVKTGPRGPKGARGASGVAGRRGSIGKTGQRGIKGSTGTLHKAEILDRLVTHLEDVYQQLTAQAKRIADLQRQLDQISGALPSRP
jgi:collagen triple helix repeat protein